MSGIKLSNATLTATENQSLWHPVQARETVTMTWFSDIALGMLDSTTLAPLCPLVTLPILPALPLGPAPTSSSTRATSSWDPCVPAPVYVPANQSMSQLISSGPEDPRLFFDNTGLTFHSLPSGTVKGQSCLNLTAGRMYRVKIDRAALKPLLGGEGHCPVLGGSELAVPPVVAVELKYRQSVRRSPEKNWIRFFHSRLGEHFIYSLYPYEVVRAQPDGDAETHYRGGNPRIAQTVLDRKVVFHGGANALLVEPWNLRTCGNKTGGLCDRNNGTGKRLRWSRSAYYLASFHTIDREGRYRNYVFEFASGPPFEVLRVSRALPLLQSPVFDRSLATPITFQSGMTFLANGNLAVSYGSSNADARVLIMGQETLESFFDDPAPQ
eukprot:CAMPEP_0175175552 /NCGR_PEP_ID=MMETSP0087-20121206/33270_1 /TAXON_ID=136419 /ORGANISM="Unknown Unknown, Strain D1" /LENGTH=381 /DNA_ID=CAMNT_0016467183 /DNA_START=134 /DNA_END=1280 /DNA_ORIENTATION=+